MPQRLNPVQIRRLLARTLRVALDGGPAHQQLIDRWANAEAGDEAWLAAITWDGVGAALGWALAALELRQVAPPELDLVAADAYHEAGTQAVLLSAELDRLGTEFQAAGLTAIALKGSAMLASNVAPALGIRWMSDIDLLVEESQVEQVAWMLESLDYIRGLSRDPQGPELWRPYHESFTNPDGRVVELHWRLGPTRWGRAAAASEWFQRAEPSAIGGLLAPAAADLFWHFLLHDARNHAWSSGSLRAALDLALVARARGFTLADVMSRLDTDPRPEPLMEAIADAAHLSPILAAEIEPSIEPRYLRLARWRETMGRRKWKTERVAEAIAWGATLDRSRRFGGWRHALDRAVRIIPEAAPGESLFAAALRGFLTVRHALFVAALALGHLIAVPGPATDARRRLPRPRPPGTG